MADLCARLGYSFPRFKHSAVFAVAASSAQTHAETHVNTHSHRSPGASSPEARAERQREEAVKSDLLREPGGLLLGLGRGARALETHNPACQDTAPKGGLWWGADRVLP